MSVLHHAGARAAAVLLLAVAAACPALAADTGAAAQKAQVCVACHGPAGVSANPTAPSLAGQPAQFVATQLLMFREAKRKDPQMSPFAANLSNADINELAEYFAAQKLTLPAAGVSPEAETGARLARQLNCVQCHGPTLMGQQHIPRLAGQQREYLKTQLRGFKAQTRFDMDGQMTSAAQPLSDPDIEALANYMAGLR